MTLIDRDKLREVLMREQAKYIMSDHMQGKHTSAGFLLAIAELDSQPEVEAITVEDLRLLWTDYVVSHGNPPENIETLIVRWRKETKV